MNFSGLLAPCFLRMFKQVNEDGILAQTLNEAVMTLIPKKGKDLEENPIDLPLY